MIVNKLNSKNIWDFENAFYWFTKYERIEKIITHFELIKKYSFIPGDIFEFGVFKGSSIIRTLSFLKYLNLDKKLIAFDAFGEFPKQKLTLKSDIKFAQNHDKCSFGLSLQTINKILKSKKFKNFKLIKGNVFNTLPKFQKENKFKISMLFMDLDVKEPTLFVLQNLFEKVSPGGIIIFDNYGIVSGETKAVNLYLNQKKLKLKNYDKKNRFMYIIKNK